MYAKHLAVAILCLVIGYGATREKSNIHMMVIGNRAIEVADTVQLTTRADGTAVGAWMSPDGKYVACLFADDPEKPAICRLVTIRASGGRPMVLAGISREAIDDESPKPGEYVVPRFDEGGAVVWSPDGKLLAFPAERAVVTEEEYTESASIVVYTPVGFRRATFDTEGLSLDGRIIWSRDSRRLATAASWYASNPDEAPKTKFGIYVCDLARGVGEQIVSQEGGMMRLIRWSDDGRALLYTTIEKGKWQLREYRLDAGGDSLIQNELPSGLSPNGKLRVTWKPGLQVENLLTGETITVLKEFKGPSPQWTPDSNWLWFRRPETLWDEDRKRGAQRASIWLAAAESDSINHMCVASDVDINCVPSFSADCLRMAYISRGRLHVAELAWKDLTTDDKLAAGVPLTEEEEKEKLLDNAKRIGIAFNMYNADWDDRMPLGDVPNTLVPYFGNWGGASFQNPFFRPGTEDLVFQYYQPSSLNILDVSATTIIGSLDVGYAWRVVIYADGHVAVIPK